MGLTVNVFLHFGVAFVTPLGVTLEKPLRHRDAADVATDFGRVDVRHVQLQGPSPEEGSTALGTLHSLRERKQTSEPGSVAEACQSSYSAGCTGPEKALVWARIGCKVPKGCWLPIWAQLVVMGGGQLPSGDVKRIELLYFM